MKMLPEIDYTPLREMKGAWKKVLRETFHMKHQKVIGLAILLFLLSVVFFPAGLFLAIGMLVFQYKYSEEKKKTWRRFAEVNGWRVTLAPAIYEGLIPPGIANEGHSKKLGDIVHAEFEGHQCDLFTYQFTLGNGKNSKNLFFTIARVELSQAFPHIIIDSKSSWSIRNRGSANRRVSLEGDFDKYFSLYHESDEHIDALSIITPDIMKVLIVTNRSQDIEIVGESMYFMISGDSSTADSLPQLLHAVNALTNEIAHKAKTLRYLPPDKSRQSATTGSLFGL